MKSLTKGEHQISDDLIDVNTVYSWYASFSRATVHRGMLYQTCLLFAGWGW